MKKNIFFVSALIAALGFTGCGDDKSQSLDKAKEKAKADEQISASVSLQEFMTNNPSFAKASIHDIRALADSGRTSLNSPILERSMLDTSKAKEANALLDQVMDKTDAKSFLDAMIKLMAVSLNFPGEDSEKPNMSCQEFVENPAKAINKASNGEISEKQVNDKLSEVGQQFKKSLNDCSKISGEEFARCMVKLGKLFSKVQEEVTCLIKSEDELEKAIGYSEAEKKELEKSCLGAFKKCGFNMDIGGGEGGGPTDGEGPADQQN